MRRLRWVLPLVAVAVVGVAAVVALPEDDDAEDAATPAIPTTAPAEEADTAAPVTGGTLRIGLRTDTVGAWNPAGAVCGTSCELVLRTVLDPLARRGSDGEAVPYLAASIGADVDATTWTIVPRAGVTFHDGTPLDAGAICANLAAHGDDLAGGAVRGVRVRADGGACVVTLDEPRPRFALELTRSVGLVASPSWLAVAASDPAAALRPVGTGPFRVESYEPGGAFVATRNPTYWRAAEGLPRVDRVELRPLPVVDDRLDALRAGVVDVVELTDGAEVAALNEDDEGFELEVSSGVTTDLLALSADDPVLRDQRVRRALALATDTESLAVDWAGGLEEEANGPFPPGAPGHLDDTGHPAFDLAAATALVEEVEADTGPLRLAVTMVDGADGAGAVQRVAAGWQAAGIEVELAEVEPGSDVVAALEGNFQVLVWRAGGEPALELGDPDDPDVAALDGARRAAAEADVGGVAAELNRLLGERVAAIWLTWSADVLVLRPSVRGLVEGDLDPALVWLAP